MARTVKMRGQRHKGPDRVEYLDELTPAGLFCHAWRKHRWETYFPLADEFPRPSSGVLEAQLCLCGSKRYGHFSRVTGQQIQKWKIVYPDGYLLAHGLYADGEDYRKEYFRQVRKGTL